MGKLTAKQEAFCREYLVDLNATQAAIRAGYSKNTAKATGSENLTKPDIAANIAEMKGKRMERAEINADYVLNRLIEIDEMDIADILDDQCGIKPVKEWPKAWRRTLSGMDVSELWEGSGDEREIAGLLKKIKWPDKLKNLELLGKHIEVNAFKEVVDHNHKGEIRTITRTIVDPKAPPGK